MRWLLPIWNVRLRSIDTAGRADGMEPRCLDKVVRGVTDCRYRTHWRS